MTSGLSLSYGFRHRISSGTLAEFCWTLDSFVSPLSAYGGCHNCVVVVLERETTWRVSRHVIIFRFDAGTVFADRAFSTNPPSTTELSRDSHGHHSRLFRQVIDKYDAGNSEPSVDAAGSLSPVVCWNEAELEATKTLPDGLKPEDPHCYRRAFLPRPLRA